MVPAQLRELAGILSDQRLHLAEQWQKLLDVQESWQEERAAALAELETTAEQLSRRDRELRLAEERTQRNWEDLNRRREELTAAGEALEGWRARQSIEESAWQAQHEALLAAIKEREQLVESRGQQVEEEAHRAERRHEEERTRLEQARARCEEARRQYCNLWQEAEQLQASLAEKERELTGEALALERLRVEVVHSSGNSARVESRLDKLARREVARLDADARHLEAERERLEREHQHLDDESKRLVQFEENLLARQRDWSRQVADWEQQRARADEEEVRRQAELRRLRAQNAVYERQLHQLREEIERLARVLIENAPEPPAQQAA
jgi:fused signal recognition particle receptor